MCAAHRTVSKLCVVSGAPKRTRRMVNAGVARSVVKVSEINAVCYVYIRSRQQCKCIRGDTKHTTALLDNPGSPFPWCWRRRPAPPTPPPVVPDPAPAPAPAPAPEPVPAAPVPAGGKQTTTNTTCSAASSCKSPPNSATGSATRAANLAASRRRSATGCRSE